MILANLGTHICDPANRLRVVHDSVQEAKERFSQMSPEEILNFTALTMAPTGLNLLTGLAPKWRAFNVVISNVPGPKEPLYWNGAKLKGMYPVSIVLDRIALNITLTSYQDQLEFGLIACRRTLPSMQRLLDYLEQSIRELEIAAGIK
jgi:diacylglycerol O-acyltransferase